MTADTLADLIWRLRDLYVRHGTNCVQQAADTIERLIAERDAEKLKRQQAEHERDWILETLANMTAERDALRELLQDMRQHQGRIQPYIKRIDAALAAKDKP
jgi:FtsZ-binding cell division protein ZapB